MALLWGSLLLKMVRVSKAERITSIADFIASRYGKSQLLGGW
jgi:Na+/proline symporter